MSILKLENTIKLIKGLAKELGIPENSIKLDKNHSESGYYSQYYISINTREDYFNFTLDGSPTGCGLLILHHMTSCLYSDTKAKMLKKVLDFLFKNELQRAGLVICTLGSGYYKDNGEDKLTKIVGFEETCEYSNPNMANGGQKVFIKKYNQVNLNNKNSKSLIDEFTATISIPDESTEEKEDLKKTRKRTSKSSKPIDAIAVGRKIVRKRTKI